jgi:hypothetical protein
LEDKLKEALVRWFSEVYDSYNRGNFIAMLFRDTAINMFRIALNTPNLMDYCRELYLILKDYFKE